MNANNISPEVANYRLGRKYIDVGSSFTQKLTEDVYRNASDWRDFYRSSMPPSKRFRKFALDPDSQRESPELSGCIKYCHTAINKSRCPIHVAKFTPEGRWLITGSHMGEFTIWNTLDFSFNRIIGAHDKSIRCMSWSHNGQWMVTGDLDGQIKLWNSSIRMMKEFTAHSGPVRGLAFSPTDARLITCSDDLSIKLWDFATGEVIRNLEGHGFDVKALEWHPSKSLVVSGGRDNLVKLWNPKTGTCLRTLTGHKNTITVVNFNPINENWFLSASRDQTIQLWDLRMLRGENPAQNSTATGSVLSWNAHGAEVYSAAWHPVHQELLATGSFDGAMRTWYISGGDPEPQLLTSIPAAHEGSIWSLDWSPLGYLLASGSNDNTAKFWTRMKPGAGRAEFYKGYQKNVTELDHLNGGSIGFFELEKRRALCSLDMNLEKLSSELIPGMSSGPIGKLADKQAFLVLAPPEAATAKVQALVKSELEELEKLASIEHQQYKEDFTSRGRGPKDGGGGGDHKSSREPRTEQKRKLHEIAGPRHRGRLLKYSPDKGWGFVVPFDLFLPESIFVHASDIEPGYGKGGEKALVEGDIIEFTPQDSENKKSGARQVKANFIVSEEFLMGIDKTQQRVGYQGASAQRKSGFNQQPRQQHNLQFASPPPPLPLPPPPTSSLPLPPQQFNNTYPPQQPGFSFPPPPMPQGPPPSSFAYQQQQQSQLPMPPPMPRGMPPQPPPPPSQAAIPAEQVQVLRQLISMGDTPEVNMMLSSFGMKFSELKAALDQMK